MSAVDYVTLDDVLENFQYQCEINALLAPFSAVILAYRLANSGFLSIELTQEEKNDMLRKLTGCTVGTGTTMNCYPRGYDLTLCFDLDGEEIP